MPVLVSRLRAILVALAAALLAVNLLVPAAGAVSPEPQGLDAFMRALGQVESSGRYDAINAVSGAYGKYQIMPSNWPAWARRFVGDASAPTTPENQEKVARGQAIALYRWLGSWPRVACWWLTGSTAPAEQWSAVTRKYVDKVMKLAGGMGWTFAVTAPAPSKATGTSSAPKASAPATPPPPVHLSEHDPAIAYSGSWGNASHPGYAGGSVTWSTSQGATASVTFIGRSIAWTGPVGPTRGAAQVWIDGQLVTTVTEQAASYAPRATIWTRDFGGSGSHTLRIVVVGGGGHPMVAIDELVVGF